MYLRIASILGLLVLLLAKFSDATKVISELGEITTSEILEEDPQTLFRTKQLIMVDDPLFDRRTQRHTPAVFYDMANDEAQRAFTIWFFKLGEYKDVFPKSFRDKEVFARIKAINSQDVAQCQSLHCCKFLIRTIYGLSKTVLQSMSGTCVKKLTYDVYRNKPGRDIKHIFDLLPDTIFAKYGSVIVSNLHERVSELKPAIFQKVLQDVSTCSIISKKSWEKILKNVQMVEKVTPECLQMGRKEFAKVDAVGLKIYKLGPKAFSLYNSTLLSKVTINMTSEQVGAFAEKFEEGQFPGGNLPPNALSSANASGLTLRHLLGFLYKEPGRYLSDMTKPVWAKVPDRIFEKLTALDVPIISAAIRNVDGDETHSFQAFLKPKQVEDLIKFPEICEIIEPMGIRRNISLTRSCFNRMSPRSQAAVIAIGGELPDDLLSQVPAEKVKDWSRSELNGLEVLNLASRRDNVSAIIGNLGSQLDFDHPCQLIDSLDTLKNSTTLQLYMSLNCFENMEFTPEKDHYLGLNPRLKFLIPFEKMKRTYSKESWEEMTVDTLEMIISGGQFCSAVDVDTMALINPKAYSAITEKCLHELRVFNELPKENIQAIVPSHLSSLTSDMITSETIGKLTPDQLAALGASSGDEKSPATLFTLDTFNSFGVEHLSKVTPDQWKHTDPKVFATFSTEERLASVQPENMVFWNTEQVSPIPNEVITKLSAAQVENIGKSCDPTKSPLPYLAKLSFSNEIQKIISRRIDNAPIEGKLGWKTIALIVVGVLVVIGGIGAGVYFFMNRG